MGWFKKLRKKFKKGFKKFGKWAGKTVKKVASPVLKVGLGAVGGLVGGPAGAALGAKIGSKAGSFISKISGKVKQVQAIGGQVSDHLDGVAKIVSPVDSSNQVGHRITQVGSLGGRPFNIDASTVQHFRQEKALDEEVKKDIDVQEGSPLPAVGIAAAVLSML